MYSGFDPARMRLSNLSTEQPGNHIQKEMPGSQLAWEPIRLLVSGREPVMNYGVGNGPVHGPRNTPPYPLDFVKKRLCFMDLACTFGPKPS